MNQEHFWTNFLPLFIYTQKFTLQKIPRTQNTHKTKTYCIAQLIRALYFLLYNLQIHTFKYTFCSRLSSTQLNSAQLSLTQLNSGHLSWTQFNISTQFNSAQFDSA